LRYVSVYAFAAEGGLVLLDSGWDSEESWQALCAGLAMIGGSPGDVRAVLVSHFHLDHSGLAGRLRAESGAWIGMHPADRAVVDSAVPRDPVLAVARETAFLCSLGAPSDEAAQAVGTAAEYAKFTEIALPDRELVDGDLVDVPGRRLRAVHTPGHTPGHLCFVDEASRLLFGGDHILPRITPNISVQADGPARPLADYLGSLAKVRHLDVDEIMPAHEWRFRGLGQRAADIASHHERRLAELLTAIAAHPDATPWDLAGRLTWSRPWDQYGGHLRVSAVTETAAHVRELVDRGLVTADSADAPGYRLA
jgi:glyoxylase-like metal-dependent hydrolase (beta-lactamase superfamily II)